MPNKEPKVLLSLKIERTKDFVLIYADNKLSKTVARSQMHTVADIVQQLLSRSRYDMNGKKL